MSAVDDGAGSGSAHHPEGVREPAEAGQDRDEQGNLQGERSRIGVDADDLGLDVLRLPGQLLFQLRCCSCSSASSSSAVETCCCSLVDSTLLLFAMCVKARDRVASMIAPANASPKDRPKEPAAELTPAASLTRSSEMGDRV